MAKKKKESLSRTLAEVSKGVTKTVANDKSVSAKVRKQAKSDYRKASRISNSSAAKNYISNSRLRRTGSNNTSATSASMANRMRGESASQRNAGGNTIREIARRNTPKKNSVSRTYSELQNKTKGMNLTDTAVGRGMARAGLTAKGTAKEAYGGVKTTFSAIRDPNEGRNIKADRLREHRDEQTKGNKYEGAYDKLRNAQRDNREQRAKDLKSASKMLESASADKEKAKKGLGKAGKFALDVESALLGMAGDAAVGAVTGTGQVGALGSMFVRSFGGGYDLAKREGASDSQAALYAAVTGGKEVLTEKMFNVGKAFSGVFGKGLGDDVINRAAEKGAEKLAKKFGSEGAKNVILHGSNYLASALTEGLEEVASTASDPFVANAIYARAVGNPHSFDAGDTFHDFLVGAALGGLGGGIAEASNYSQGGQVKNVLGKDGLKEVADRVAYADEDSGISDSAKAISQMILNGENVANAQALKLYKAAEAQEQKNFTQYRDAIKGATSIIERDNLISPSGLTVDESGQVIPSIGDNTNIKFQEARTEARSEAEKLQLKDDMAASIGDTIASIKAGIGVVDDIETIVRYPEAKAVYESVTGETLPSGRKALREYLYKKNAENRVQSAREETEFWKDQAVGLLSQTETEDFGGNGQAVFTKATENLDVNELGNSALTKVRTTINDYYNSAKLGIPFSTLNDIAKPEYEAVSEDIKREAYNAGVLDSNDIYKYLDGVAVNKDESIKSSANKENRNANPGKLYVDADNAARKYFTNSQQKLWKRIAEEFGIGIHIMDAESFADTLRAKGQNEVADSESLPNGFYDNGEIYLNVETPDRATRYVFMHEFSHFLEQTAPKEYSDLRKRMIDALIEDGSLERRLSRKRMQYGEGISQDDLIDEILADSTYEFLNDKDFANGIARESENLAQAIINAIRNLIRKIRNVLARDEYTPSQNANMYAQLGILKDMETLWLDAVNAARENAAASDMTRTNDNVKYSTIESFQEQVEKALKGELDPKNAVYIGETPKKLIDVGLNKLPLLITQNHIRSANRAKSNTNKKSHDIDKNILKRLPELISEPAMITDSLSTASTKGIVVITNEVDNEGKPIIVPIKPDGSGYYFAQLDSNFVLSVYGRNGFLNFIENNIKENTFLYINSKKSQELSTRIQLQLLQRLNGFDFDTIIRKSKNVVNDNFNTTEDKDIRFSLLDNYTVDNNGELVHLDKGLSAKPQRARYTEERIDDILETYGSDSEKYAQAYITSMSPRTFLKLTLSDEKRSEWERAEKEGTRTDEIFPLDTEQLKNESQTPFLKIDSETGEVLSHEGRHRMLAMYNAGLRNVPVVVIDNKTKYSKTITPSMTLLSQDFGDGNVNYGYKVSVTNLIPTNKVYKDKIMEAYGNNAAIKFSKKEPVADEVNVNYSDIRYSKKVTDKDTIDFLENQEQVEVYRAMALIDGKLYPPMATKIKGEDGKYTLQNGSNIGEWEEAEERPDLIDKKTGKFILKKDNGTSVAAAYNPYIHTSLSPLNDQFSSAYKRPNMVVVKGVIPSSELTSGYRAEGAKDTVGETAWHAGPVATQLNKVGKPRRVILSRWFKPVEIMSDDDVADSIRDTLDGTGIEIPYNVVTPSVRRKLEERGVSIGEGRGNKLPPKDSVKFSRKDSEGNELSDGQIDFFADSKARDEDGNLMVMYHGTPSGNFTVFRDGSYFTPNKEYADKYQSENASSISTGKIADNPKTYEVYLNITKPFTLSDTEARRIYIDEYIKGGNAIGINPYLSDSEYDAIDNIDWTEGEDLRDFLKENEYDYDGIILNEGAVGGYGEEVKQRGDSYVVFEPTQVKNVDNLNPTENEDIRFSKKESADASLSEMENVESVPTDEEVYEYMASHPEIYKEMWSFDEADKNYIKHKQNTYAELETKVEQLKQNQKKTHGKVLDEKSVRPAINELVKSILQASELGRGVKKTDNKMVNDCVANAKKIFTAYKNSDTELMITTSLNAAESMVESLKFIDDSAYVYYKDLRDYLRNTPIRVSDTIKGDIADYSAWRKSKFGKIRISDVGIPVDDVYTELCEKFPEMFDRELSNPTDQLLRMGEAIEEIQPYVVYLSSEEYDNLIRQTAGDLIDIAVKGRAYKSMADRYEERISAVKQRAEEARKDAQKKKKDAVNKEREKASERLAEEKDKREQAVSKEREKADTRVAKERDKRKKADNRRKEAYKRRNSMKMLVDDYKWLSSRILKPTDDKHVPDRMVAPLAELLQYIDLETEYSKKFEKKTGKPTAVAVNLRNLKSALEDVSKSSEANWILEDEDLPQMIEELQKRIEGAAIYELDNSELDAVQALLHAIRVDVSNANKAFVASRSIDDTAKAVIWEANEYAANSKKRRSGGIVNQLLNESMVKPMEFFEHLGPTMKSVYMGLRRGMDVQSNRMKETRAFFAEVFEGYGKKGKPGSEVQKWRNEKTLQEFELQSGDKISLNTAQIMSLHCLSKRKQAMGHICGQGICASEIRDFGAIRSTIGDKEAHKKSTTMVTEKDVMNIISTLTDEQVEMANKLQDYLNTTVAQWGNETSLLMYDRKKFTEENYFPIKTQDVYLDANFEKRQRDIESIKNFGFTKGTVVNANNPIVIDDIFAVVAKHVNQMILYNAYAPAISDFTRVYNYREVEGNQVESVQAIIADTYGGKIIDQYISKFMSDLQSNTQTRRGGYERVANILLANYKKAAIGASPRVALQQPTAMVRALAEIDAKYFVKMEHSPQLLQMATKKDNALKEMLEHCPIAYWKSMGFNQVDMARDIEDIMMNMEWSRLDVLTMSIYGALDTYTWSKIWKAIKAEQKDLHPEVEYESDEFWELCNERAIEVFDKTQVVDSVFHRSDVMRSDNLLIKSITSFMSEPTTTFNMLRSNLMRANDLRVQGKGKEAFKLTGRTLGVYVANAFACAMAAAIADAILKKQTGDDDDEENKSFIEFWLANTIVNFKSNVSPLNLMPITRDFSSFADGWGTKNMFEEGIALVIEDAVAIKNKATDPASTKKTWEELITELAKDSSYLTGIPVKNFMRYGAGILDFLGINAFAAEKDSEGGQSKSLFGEILEIAGFSNGDDSANSQSQSLESQYEESWLTKKLHEAGITEGTRLDNVLNFFGLNKSIEEQKEEHYQDMLEAAKAAGNGYVGVEKDEKIYSKATEGYTKLAETGEFEELARMRRVLVELDVDTTNFDERVESHIKTGIKKQIGEKGDSKLRNRLLNQLKEVYGYTDEQISTDVLAKTDTATAFQKALCEDNYDEAVKQLRYLRQAGLTYDAFIDLYEKRWKVIDAKTTGTFSWPAQGRISSGFGQRWGTLHAGIDIAMPTGTEVVASDGGEVVYTGYNSAMGNYVDIKHSNGYVTRYQHLSSYGVLKGEKVKKGQYIASSGNTGNSTGPHLHFAVYRSTSHSGCSHSTAVDPSIFLN